MHRIVIWWIGKSMCTSMCFQVLTQLGSIPFTLLEGLKSIRLQIADRSVDRCQDRMLGLVSILALWDTCSGYH